MAVLIRYVPFAVQATHLVDNSNLLYIIMIINFMDFGCKAKSYP